MSFRKYSMFECTVEYSAQKTPGTKFAEEHLKRTRRYPDGDMLVPPTKTRLLQRKTEILIRELEGLDYPKLKVEETQPGFWLELRLSETMLENFFIYAREDSAAMSRAKATK